jgi:hypothetical protein
MVNEQVIDGDYFRDGADRCSFCGIPWCCGLYLLWLSMKISVLSQLRTELMIHLAYLILSHNQSILYEARLSLNPSSWYCNHLEAGVQWDTKRYMYEM